MAPLIRVTFNGITGKAIKAESIDDAGNEKNIPPKPVGKPPGTDRPDNVKTEEPCIVFTHGVASCITFDVGGTQYTYCW